jgi:excisionase family DNA binding protein
MRPLSADDTAADGGLGDFTGARLQRQTYTVPEAAALLGISRAKAYQCVRSGEIKAIQFGRRIVVPAWVIDQLLGTDVGAA